MSESKGYYTPAQKRATMKYLEENREQLRLWVHKGDLDALRAEAASIGQSMAGYVIQAVNEYAGRQILTPAESSRSRKARSTEESAQ